MVGVRSGYRRGMPRSAESESAGPTEDDVAADRKVAGTRETGGADDHPAAEPDAETTTGTGRNEEFVGRVAGQDEGFAGETGAEARAEQERGR
jgi:hypothetical protein